MQDNDSQELRTQPVQRRFGFLGGALAGFLLVALMAVGWALGGGDESTPASLPVSDARSDGATVGEQPSPHGAAPIGDSPIRDLEIERMRSELESDPARLDLRKQLAVRLLRQAEFYAAFDEAKLILEQSPDDVDGLFVTAAVRVRMGQPSRALPMLERVLEQAPEHVPALTAKGQALLRAGHEEAAVAVWTRALELSGGRNSQVEELLRTVPSASL